MDSRTNEAAAGAAAGATNANGTSSSYSASTTPQQQASQQSPSRPLLGELARSSTASTTTTTAAVNPAQAARRTFATAGSASSSTSSPNVVGSSQRKSSSSSSGRRQEQASSSASGHQSQLRQATAAAAMPSLSSALNLGTAAAAAAAAPMMPNQRPPPRSPPRRAEATSAVPAAPLSGSTASASAAAAIGAAAPPAATTQRAMSSSVLAAESSPSSAAGTAAGAGSAYQDLRSRLGGQGQQQQHAHAQSMQQLRASDSTPIQEGSGGGGGGGSGSTTTTTNTHRSKKGWSTVEVTTGHAGGIPPCQRSLHAAAALNGSMYVFGGYDGQARLNDFHSFNFADARWSPVLPSASSGPPPSPRDRHVALVHGTAFYVFGGFDGTSRVSDFYGFDFSSMMWRQVVPLSGSPPSPRHSHSAVVYENSAYVYGGYDGSYRSDFHQFNFETRTWSAVTSTGRAPRARYRATTVVHLNTMVLFGGHDGTRHLSDTHIFDFDTCVWTAVLTEGTPPIPRDSHVSVVHVDSMYVFGGSTGSAMNDLLELQLPTTANPTAKWRSIETPPGGTAGHRFCHVAVQYEDSMYVFGGYDGSHRLNDFIRFDFDVDDLTCEIPPSTLVTDLKSLVNDDALSDIIFIVEGQHVHAHKILLMRCPYFQAMLLGPMMESSQSEIRMEQVSHSIFLLLLEYLYTDTVKIPLDAAMDLFAAANQFSLPRLQAMCEKKMLESITISSAATIFLAADMHSAENLRNKSLKYILAHFEQVSKTDAFEEMARGNVELVFEILRNR